MGKTILFVCTGNTCRSPMAEGLLRKMAKEAGLSLDVHSAGVAAMEGSSISSHSQKVLADKGIESGRSAQAVKEPLVAGADLILTMTVRHKNQLLSRFPAAEGKVFTLLEYAGSGSEEEQADADRELAELVTKHSLGGKLTAAERERALFLESLAQDQDISDPFGGTLEDYRICARDIEDALKRIVERLKRED
ncbi:low molecular weight protein arginine phosphatase [Gorillibacterium sp. sgz500922]|uniref:low molecular weight protein arginine phosphatase n=1 Tax=Gorillibacterium sp. sgz500922 TaxID=3446694 RepID=UPI003F681324